MPVIRSVLSAKEVDARRRNAQKSTGPRTEEGKRRAALNAFQRRPARPGPLPTMQALGEEPSHYQRLLEELVRAYQPTNPAERMLVEDIALLRLRKQRNQQAQNGLIRKSLEKLGRERYERQQEITYQNSNFSQERAAEVGLLNIEDSPAKFKEVARLLDLVIEEVNRGDFREEGSKLLLGIFGPNPSIRGARVLGFYSHLQRSGAVVRALASSGEDGNSCTSDDADVGARLPAPGADPSGAEPGVTEEEAALAKSVYDDLCLALLEERKLVGERYERYLAEHVPSIPAVRAAALAPSEQEYRALIRQEQFLDQQIERKTKLLLFMQWVERSAERNAQPYIYARKKRS